MQEWLDRERLMLGDEAVERLKRSCVMIFGVGGVGGFALEGIVRSGVGRLALVDADTVSPSNINRQIIADTTTVGMPKVRAAAERIARINPDCEVTCIEKFADATNIGEMLDQIKPDFVIDAIDTVSSKVIIIEEAKSRNIGVISSMGTGSKLDPTRFRVVDIAKTHTCPLAKAMRIKLRSVGIEHCDVLFSDEPPIKRVIEEQTGETVRHVPGSVSFVPSVAGLVISGYVVRRLSEI